MRPRVLVLTSATGSGHDMRAMAFTEWVQLVHGDRVEVRIERIIENSSTLGRFGVWIYNTIQRLYPRLHHVYFFIVEAFVRSHSGSVSFGGKYYRQLLRDWQPTVVFSVHDSTNYGYFEDAKRILGPQTRCVTYCGEYSGGYGYSRNWVNPVADHFIARTRNAADFAKALGMSPDRISVFHRFLPPGNFTRFLDAPAHSSLKTELGFTEDRFTVFLATGGYGANHHRVFLQALLPLKDRVQVIVVCGRNAKIHAQLGRWQQAHPQLPVHLEGFSKRMADYLQISDAIVTRGGANTTTEAIHFNCPILFNSLGGLMPQEHCTVRYLVERGAAALVRSPEQLAGRIRHWIENPLEHDATRRQLSAMLHPEEHPRDLLATVLNQPTPT